MTKANQQNKSKREPAQADANTRHEKAVDERLARKYPADHHGPNPAVLGTRQPTRYSVRADDGTKVEEIYLGTDKGEAIRRAEKRHAETGQKVWAWSLKTGKSIHRIERAEVAGAR